MPKAADDMSSQKESVSNFAAITSGSDQCKPNQANKYAAEDPTPSPRTRRNTRRRKRIDYAKVHNGNDIFEAQTHGDVPADDYVDSDDFYRPEYKQLPKKNSRRRGESMSSASSTSPPEFWGLPTPPLPPAPPGKLNVYLHQPLQLPSESKEEEARLQRISIECPECRLLLAPVKTKSMRGWCCAYCTKFYSTNRDWGFVFD
eukprot:CAMPEP_0167751022 /NCGR_PEP_ID=MMETSP0110_2-20121227/6324_1 /TAXON_ID=629695 /ORGANISM="Gymnochlora sp., Strain CCMP2014" /LENGTH=201 /DNA_ID=CAMNT_0007636425 /DNA_START=175 /DNA_END=780 /DNA_ORIENTATION=+